MNEFPTRQDVDRWVQLGKALSLLDGDILSDVQCLALGYIFETLLRS